MTDQLALFVPTGPEKTNGELFHDRMHTLATSPEVIDFAITLFRARPGEFIATGQLFHALRDRFNLGSYVMNTLHHLNLRLGLLEERRIYFGAESPCSTPATKPGKRGKQAALEKPYLGYASEWRLKESE
jgi:hypothetical protein